MKNLESKIYDVLKEAGVPVKQAKKQPIPPLTLYTVTAAVFCLRYTGYRNTAVLSYGKILNRIVFFYFRLICLLPSTAVV